MQVPLVELSDPYCDVVFSKEEVSSFVESENLKYQSIQLPYGIKTPGDDRNEAVKLLLHELKANNTVLDVGSFLGLFCITALQQGASAVTGLELNRDRLRQAKCIADFLQLNPNYLRLDVEDFPELEKHDVVLCLNVLHHLKNPVGVLRYLALHTADTLIIEAAQFGVHDVNSLSKIWQKDMKLSGFAKAFLRRIFPAVLKSTNAAFVAPYSPSSFLRTFFFSKLALDTMLNSHMKLFSSVEIKSSSFKDRFFVVCKKLKIKHLVVVSGACGSGKSTFIDKALANGCGDEIEICKDDFVFVNGNRLRNKSLSESFSVQSNDSVVFHYDINSIIRYGIHSYDRDQSLDILMCADKVSVVLLAPLQDVLLSQMVASETRDGSMSKYHQGLQKNYNSLPWVRELYLDWISFLKNRLGDVNDCRFYDYDGRSNQLYPCLNADSLRDIVEHRYSGVS